MISRDESVHAKSRVTRVSMSNNFYGGESSLVGIPILGRTFELPGIVPSKGRQPESQRIWEAFEREERMNGPRATGVKPSIHHPGKRVQFRQCLNESSVPKSI